MHKKKRRGANSTRTHERHREAPLREARQAAPDWARASAALSSFNESSRFSRGPSRCDAKYGLFVTSSQCCHWQRYEVYRDSPWTARALRRAWKVGQLRALRHQRGFRSEPPPQLGEPRRRFPVGFERRQGHTAEAAFAVDKDALVVAKVAELVGFQFVFLSFGVVHVPLTGAKAP